MSLAAYIHIPFCKTRCPYCDFYSTVETTLIPRYAVALCREIELVSQANGLAGETLSSLFLGGGTPSLLDSASLQAIMNRLRDSFEIASDCEITAEVNPDDVDDRRAEMWRESGLSRISLGAQSFDNGELAILGRRHDSTATRRAIKSIRGAGFENISLDLIYGIPGQSVDRWMLSVEHALALSPCHISAYCLTLEEGTVMDARVKSGELVMPDDDTVFEMYESCAARLQRAGFEHYEVSNYAVGGCRCRHNMAYWTFKPYVGFGPAAASYRDGRRWKSLPDLAGYMAALERGELPEAEAEDVCGEIAEREEIMLSLRLSDGLNLRLFRERHGWDLATKFERLLAEFSEAGLLELSDERAVLTERGMFLSDYVIGHLC